MPLHQDSQPGLQVHGASFEIIVASANKVAQAGVGGLGANS